MTSSKQSNATDAVEGKLGSRKPARKQADAISPRSSSEVLLVYVGRQVFAARQRLGLTQEQLAEKARCGPATVFLVENARRNVTIRSLSVLAAALGMEVAELFPRPKSATPSARADGISRAMAEEVARAQEALRRIERLAHQIDQVSED